ncbi:MAG: GNAT family N-acetyltransferase [Burkholderiaceae bacterium]|nr:GNAT family N-acetyltransferase [Burkholderiaceae bacterium]
MVHPAPDLPLRGLDRLRRITDVYTEPNQRRQGHARWLMCSVCAEADASGIVLLLEAVPFDDGALDAAGLERFYEGLGFCVAQREPVLMMARGPR